MTVRSHLRGHPVVHIAGVWVYEDTGAPAADTRPCVRCGRPPTPAGHDACLGQLPGASSACCGHGVEPPYTVGPGGMTAQELLELCDQRPWASSAQ